MCGIAGIVGVHDSDQHELPGPRVHERPRDERDGGDTADDEEDPSLLGHEVRREARREWEFWVVNGE